MVTTAFGTLENKMIDELRQIGFEFSEIETQEPHNFYFDRIRNTPSVNYATIRAELVLNFDNYVDFRDLWTTVVERNVNKKVAILSIEWEVYNRSARLIVEDQIH